MTFISPFNLRVAGNTNNSVLINPSDPTVHQRRPHRRRSPPVSLHIAGTATVTNTATTGFTVTYTGAAANTDVGNFSLHRT